VRSGGTPRRVGASCFSLSPRKKPKIAMVYARTSTLEIRVLAISLFYLISCAPQCDEGWFYDSGSGECKREADANESSSSTDGDNASIAEALAQIAELVTTVAAQQAAIVALESDVAALESDVVELEQFKSSSLCFIGHMTDDSRWYANPRDYYSEWREIIWGTTTQDGEHEWGQGPNSDAMKAYENCF